MDDRSNVTDFRNRAAPATLGQRWPQSSPAPQAIALLTTCLALVRPVGFTDDNARDWLRVAAGEIGYIPFGILENACGEARRTATHHAQIVPAIIKYADERLAHARSIDIAAPREPMFALPREPRWIPTLEELEQLKANAAASLRA
jgi:hypothetical protein